MVNVTLFTKQYTFMYFLQLSHSITAECKSSNPVFLAIDIVDRLGIGRMNVKWYQKITYLCAWKMCQFWLTIGTDTDAFGHIYIDDLCL